MSLTMTKGSSLILTKDDGVTPLTNIRVELSWNANASKSQYSHDLDVISAVCVDENLKAVGSEHIAFFNQKNTPAIQVSPDNVTGEGDGVDEFLNIDISKVPANANRIPVLVSIYGAAKKNQNFSQVDSAKVVLKDMDTGNVIGSCDITDQGSSSDESLLVGVFERQPDGTFKYNQLNEFFDKSFEDWIGVFSN